MAADVLALCLASFLGLFVRFDLNISRIPPEYAQAAMEFLPYYILASLVIFFLARMYSTMWSVAGPGIFGASWEEKSLKLRAFDRTLFFRKVLF